MSTKEAIDRCVSCGFCLQSCPTYRLFLTEESGPRGRIALAKAVLDGEVAPTAGNLTTFAECLGCRACETACPSGVPYDEVRMFGREALRRVEGPLPFMAWAVLAVVSSARRLAWAHTLWRLAGRFLKVAARLAGDRGAAALVAVAPSPAPLPAVAEGGAFDVAIHGGCLMEVFWPHTNARAAILLAEAGLRVGRLPQGTGCCGALHAHQGDRQTARRLARHTIEAFEASGASRLVSLAGGCGAFIRGYPELFAGDAAWQERGRAVADAVTDVATLLAGRAPACPRDGERVTYQDSCHLRHGLGVADAPRQLIAEVADYVEMPGAASCCGSAGIYNLVRPDVADSLLAQKARDLRTTGATTLVVTNPGCELQMRLAVKRWNGATEVRHLVDFLYERRLRTPTSGGPDAP